MSAEKMKAMVLEKFNTPLVYKDVPIPRLEPGEALIKVLNCGICGTDVKIFRGLLPPSIVTLPYIMGHEVVGEVVSVAPNVRNVQVGERVIVYFYISCGKCKFCQSGRENICINIKRCGFEIDGGYAQFQKVPARNLCPIHNISPQEAAILPDAVATTYHAIKTVGKVHINDRVLILGAGGLGIHAVQIAKLCGAEVAVVNRTEWKLDRIGELVNDVHLISPQKTNLKEYINEWTKEEGVDVVIDTVGYPKVSMEWGFSNLTRGGRFVIVGYSTEQPLPVNMMGMHYNEWEIAGSRVSTKLELIEVIRLVENHKITPIVDRVFPLEKANQALKAVQEGNVAGRIVLGNSP